MKLIVGLGNPGPQYEKTRHNAGFLVVDRLLARHGGPACLPRARFQGMCAEAAVAGHRCLLLKPMTFMNNSGRSVAEAAGFFKLDPAQDLLVIVDDSALPVGAIRLRPAGSPGGHNGLADIERALGTDAYPRLRVGIDSPPPMMVLHDYVLGRFTPEQAAALGPALDLAADAAEAFITRGIVPAMNAFNRKPTAGEEPAPDPTDA